MSIGNLATQGGKKTNYPYQLRDLQLLGAISSTLIQILASLQNGKEFEQNLVLDLGGVGCPTNCPVYLQIRIYDSGTGTFEPPVYYTAAGAVVVPVGPLQFVSPEALLESIDASLAGALRTPSVVEATLDGSTVSGVQSVALLFLGSGGTLNGVSMTSGTMISFQPNKGADTLDSIPFTVPTTGEQRVIITYVS